MFQSLLPKTAEPKPGRDYASDNLRFFLIFCVVFAHLLEIAAPFQYKTEIYRVIYSFHMPAFLFLFGYFLKPSPKAALFHWIIPYFVWQTLYSLFSVHVLGADTVLQYTQPYWLLWYMLACVYYQLLTPVYGLFRGWGQAIALLAVLVLSLAAGFDNTVGYYMSLSRFLVFQPWVLLGFVCRTHAVGERFSAPKLRHLPIYLGSAVLVGLSVFLLLRQGIPEFFLFASTSYQSTGLSVWTRLLCAGFAFAWIAFLFLTLRVFINRRLPLITAIGQNTLPVFLLHGFAVKAIQRFCPELTDTPWKVLLLTCALLLIFGSRPVKRVVDCIGLTWLGRFVTPPEDRKPAA